MTRDQDYQLKALGEFELNYGKEETRRFTRFGRDLLERRGGGWSAFAFLPPAVSQIDALTFDGGGIEIPIHNDESTVAWACQSLKLFPDGGLFVVDPWNRETAGVVHGFDHVFDTGYEDIIMLPASEATPTRIRQAFDCVDLQFGYQAFLVSRLGPEPDPASVIAILVGTFDSQGYLILARSEALALLGLPQ